MKRRDLSSRRRTDTTDTGAAAIVVDAALVNNRPTLVSQPVSLSGRIIPLCCLPAAAVGRQL